MKVAAGAVLNECQGGCLTHAPKKGQTDARPENSVTCLMKVASVRNANGQGPGRARARQNPDDYFGTTIVYSEVKSLPNRKPAEAGAGAGATDYFGSKLSPSILNESFLII